ncbi:1241_t:CDS:2 [Funneliformis mosseae]|uniref:1241_t:CDS:1 n=1 Tax=Funneliformis mosseae TaxID=27381 RepID=A0A9N9GSK9_FUNMO|nr:1241_t:CDS:2 [Funneliformis mosseae]
MKSFNEKKGHSMTPKYKSNMKRIEREKRIFLKEFSSKYGYNGKIDQIREKEYPQLNTCVYLDHTGSTVFAKSTVKNFMEDLMNNLYGNPHSNSPSSQASSMRIAGVRKRVLKFFGTNEKDYSIIFTQNATASAKLVGEMFPWTKRSCYKYLRESHNSINGLRRFPEQIDADFQSVSEDEVNSMIKNRNFFENYDKYDEKKEEEKVTYNLFAYPAQCNFSGMKFPLNWSQKLRELNTETSKTLVLLDAAAYVPTSKLSLANKDASPDFVILSFYKIFGFPTGLGALIVKNELSPILKKGYFGGGTLRTIIHNVPWQTFSNDMVVRYEDGTVNFQNIIALDHALDSMEKLFKDYKYISNHVQCLITFLSRSMRSLRHWNGEPVISVNSDRDFSDNKQQGGVFSFNTTRSDGEEIGYLEVERLASLNNIHIRSGGLCNPGSISRWNGIDVEDAIQHFVHGKVCGDENDIFNGKKYGAVRLSIGAMTTIEDVLIWLDFFRKYYVEKKPKTKKFLM